MLPTDTNKVNVLCIIDNLVDSYWICETASDGTTLQIASDNVLENDIGTITPGVPFFWAVTASGTDSGETIGYMRSLGSNTLLSQPLVGNRNFGWSAGEFRIGSTPVGGGEYWTGDIGPVMVFDRVLTAHELEVQSYYARPMFATSLHLWWPATDPSSAQDLSGNGRNGTIAGALTAGDLGNQLWSPRKRIFLPAKADGGSVEEEASYSAASEFGSTFSAVATAAGSITSGVTAGAALSARAAASASITEAIEAGDTDAAIKAVLSAFAAQVSVDEQYAAIAQAVAAIQAGLEAGEEWAAIAAAEAGLTAGISVDATFSFASQSTQSAALSAGTHAAAEFLGAVSAFALLSSGVSAGDAFSASARISASISAGVTASASLSPILANDGIWTAATSLQAEFQSVSSSIASMSGASALQDAYDAVCAALASLTAGVVLGATFSA